MTTIGYFNLLKLMINKDATLEYVKEILGSEYDYWYITFYIPYIEEQNKQIQFIQTASYQKELLKITHGLFEVIKSHIDYRAVLWKNIDFVDEKIINVYEDNVQGTQNCIKIWMNFINLRRNLLTSEYKDFIKRISEMLKENFEQDKRFLAYSKTLMLSKQPYSGEVISYKDMGEFTWEN